MREENFRVSISTQVGDNNIIIMRKIISRVRWRDLFSRKYKCVFLPLFTGALQLYDYQLKFNFCACIGMHVHKLICTISNSY